MKTKYYGYEMGLESNCKPKKYKKYQGDWKNKRLEVENETKSIENHKTNQLEKIQKES